MPLEIRGAHFLIRSAQLGAMTKDLYIEISAHFGIESVENLITDRRNRFINRYGETDNYLCQMLR